MKKIPSENTDSLKDRPPKKNPFLDYMGREGSFLIMKQNDELVGHENVTQTFTICMYSKGHKKLDETDTHKPKPNPTA